MDEPTPPRLAIWLLRHFAAAKYRESLAGDLIEQAACGRSAAWCWWQTLIALALVPVGLLQRTPWMAALKAALLALGVITLGFGTMSFASDSPRHATHEMTR